MKIKVETPNLKKLEKEYKYLKTHGLKVGFIGEEENKETGVKIYKYSFILNFGTATMPPRPFFDRAVIHKQAQVEILTKMQNLLKMVYTLKLTGKQALDQLGIYLVQRIKKMILSNDYKPLKPNTVKYKERNKKNILREHDFMLRSVAYEIIRR